jgi:hypothetical protein
MKEIGKTTIKVLLALVNAYYDQQNGYSHCSVAEFNQKYGLAKNSIPKMFQQLCEEGWIEDCTVNGYYKRFKIIKPYKCPDFVVNIDGLSNSQKNFLLKCLESNIEEGLTKKEMARRIYDNENNNNITRSFDNIEEASGLSVFQLLNKVEYIEGLVPADSEYTEHGYRTILNRKDAKSILTTELDITANHLYKKSLARFKRAANISDYDLTEDYIKELLEKQEYKDFYTGIKPEDYHEYSIDRIDSSKGYIQGNVVITTSTINLMKGEMSINEFLEKINILYNNQDKIKSFL